MGPGKFKVCTLIAIWLAFVQQSNALITETECTATSVCEDVDANSECGTGGKCVCKTDFIISVDETECVEKLTTIDCSTGSTEQEKDTICTNVDANSECTENNICVCKNGYKGTDSCVKAAVTETSCEVNGEECTVQHSVCFVDQSSSMCKCSDGYKEDSNDRSTCVNDVITDNECTSDDPGNRKCRGVDQNAVCSTDKCACKADYFLSTDKTQCVQSIEDITCTPGVTGNTKCQTEDEYSECHSGSSTCKCKAEYYLSSDKKTCKQKITSVTCKPADATDGDTKCQKVDAGSECKTGGTTCTCKEGYIGTNSCTKVLDGPCTASSECSGNVENSVCTSLKCECAANFIEESAICKTALGQACSDDDICVLNAECEDEKCKCSSGYKDTNGLCAAESSATSAWMTTSLYVTSMLIYLPRFICG